MDDWSSHFYGLMRHLRAQGWNRILILQRQVITPVGLMMPDHMNIKAYNDNERKP